MNAIQYARSAYSSNQAVIRTPRSIEAQLLSTVTAKLRKAASEPENKRKLIEAVHHNREVWTTFAVSVSDNENSLPKSLRAQLFYLAEFTAMHTSKVIRGEASTDALVDINTAVLRGLNSTGSES